MKKILYLHGFGSSGASGTVEVLRREFWGADAAHRASVIAPDIPIDPSSALPMLEGLAYDEMPDLVIGTSMGGMYAQQLHGFLRICVNPSFCLSKKYDVLYVGKHKWLNRRKDGETEFHVTKEIIGHFQDMEAHQFDGITDDDRTLCHGLFGDEDDTVPAAEARPVFERHYPGMSRLFHGGHRMNAHVVVHTLIPFIKNLFGGALAIAALMGLAAGSACADCGVAAKQPEGTAMVKFSNGTVGSYQSPVAPGDFGRDAFGWLEARATVPGPYVVRLGEQRCADGTVNTRPAGTIRGCAVTCEVASAWTRIPLVADKRNTKGVNGKAIAVELPPDVGVVMPFRYVEKVSGPGDLSFRRQYVRWPMEQKVQWSAREAGFTGETAAKLDRLFDFCAYSIRATSFAGLYVDGDRERIPYEGDLYINMLGQLYGVDGDPELARRTIRHMVKYPTWPAEWQQHFVMCVWEDWRFTGSTELAQEVYGVLREKTLIGEVREGDVLIRSAKGTIVDWPAGERDGYDMDAPYNAVVNAFHYRSLREMADLARVLGKAGDAEFFASRAEAVKAAYNEVLYDPASGLYRDGGGSTHFSLHANAAALDFGLVLADRTSKVADFIASKGMACSPYFAQYLLEALFKFGKRDEAIALLTSEGPRSWLGMLDQGATMTMEAWSQAAKPNQDWNHAWGAAPANLLPRFLSR